MKTRHGTEQDHELAAFTDALLADTGKNVKDGPAPLATTPEEKAVEMLARAITLHTPPDHLRRTIQRQIAAEWARQRRPAFGQRLRKLLERPTQQRWVWAAAAGVVLVAIVTALLMPAGAQELAATATGEFGTVVVVFLLLAAGALAAGWFISRKK